jgi:two-component system OmpR family sensor kinase
MNAKMSMTRKLVFAVTAVVAIAWLLASSLGIMVMQDEFAEIFDSAVEETAERLLPLVVSDIQGSGVSAAQLDFTQQAAGTEYLTYQARDRLGHVLIHSHDSAIEPYDVPLAAGFADTSTHRIYTAVSPDGAIFLQVADAFANRREAIVEAGVALFLPLIILIPASIIAVIFVVRRTLYPIQELRDDIGRKDSGNMAPVDASPLPSELHPIARSVNLLLERLRLSLEAEREFTSNSAHELRTPIAGALAQAQRLKAEIPAEFSPRLDQIEQSLSHLGRLAEKLLQMSRADAGIGISDTLADLVPVIRIIVGDLERMSIGDGRINLHLERDVRLERHINPDAFGIVLRNLLENALVHSPPDSMVDIYIENGNRVHICNEAETIKPEELANLRHRFTRGPTKASGSGLGLAIVSNLVEKMNANLVLSSPAFGKRDGFEAVLTF